MNNNIHKITTPDLKPNERVESGPLRINDDWAGVFIRGDNAMYYSQMVQLMLSQIPEQDKDKYLGVISSVEGLVNLLSSCME